MMKEPRKPFPYVRVEWLDAYSEDQWLYLDDYVLHDHRVETSGYLVKENEKYLLIAPTIAWATEEKKWEACTMMAVPKSMLLKPIRILKRAPPIKPKAVPNVS
jgi:hypothetical protein